VIYCLGVLSIAAPVGGVLMAPQAGAFELFGIRFFEDQADRDADAVIVDPHTYSAEVVTGATGGLEGVIRNASALVADQDEPASGAAGLLAKARGDYRRITAALYGEGYYGGTVNILVNGVEAANIPPDTRLPNPAAIQIHVNPGPEFRFNRLVIVNQAPPTLDPGDEVPEPTTLGYVNGAVARSGVVTRAEASAIEAWRQQGYAKAEVASREVVADHASNTVDVTITIAPGRPARFGPIQVQGTERMDPAFVARQTGLTEGEEYDPDELALAEKRLDRLEVFRAARLEAAREIGADGLLPYTLIVQEQAGRRFGVGASFSTVDGLGVEAYHLWRNLFGQAERLRLDARVAGIGFPVETEEFDYFFGGTFTKPGMFTPDTDLVATVSAERTVLDTYTETSAGGRLGLTHIFSDHITAEAGALVEVSRFDDDFGTRDFTIAGAYGGITFDNRDNPLDATEGFYASAQIEPFYEFNYGNPAARAIIEGRTYFGFGDNDRVVLAGRIRAGALLGPDLEEIPPDRLFFAGGGGSVRGYAFKSIGVDGPGDTVTGGRYLLEGSIEARVKVTGDIGVVGFLDGGYVAADTFPGIEDLRLGAGIGLRYATGLGPIRADLAIPLNKRDGDPDYALYIGIGQAF
jgi:translocation and assembly module TamA